MTMRKQWACPDLGVKKPEGLYNLIPGSSQEFDDCPAYYLRMPMMDLPAEHLIDGVVHPAQLIQEWSFEIEAGSRQIESLSPKAIELVHLHLREKSLRDDNDRELRKNKKGARNQ